MNDYLVEANHIVKHFPVSRSLFSRDQRIVRAVDDVTLRIQHGECLGLVGESGCGKSTLGRLLIRLIEPTGGEIFFDGIDLLAVTPVKLRKLRRDSQIIFQDPYASLNPRNTIANILSKPFLIHTRKSHKEIIRETAHLLDRVGLRPVEQYMQRFPHELSGGQRQRVVIARAISLRPKFIVADEPVSSLDVSVRSEILNLMKDLQDELGLTYLLISHDLAIVRSICDHVAVMYLGKIVEFAATEELYKNPLHPYTRALLAATAVPGPVIMRKRERVRLTGLVPSPINPPSGCVFHTRCPIRQSDCNERIPPLEIMNNDHLCACYYTELQGAWDIGQEKK